jgi:hypothetical protein
MVKMTMVEVTVVVVDAAVMHVVTITFLILPCFKFKGSGIGGGINIVGDAMEDMVMRANGWMTVDKESTMMLSNPLRFDN